MHVFRVSLHSVACPLNHTTVNIIKDPEPEVCYETRAIDDSLHSEVQAPYLHMHALVIWCHMGNL